MNAIAARHGVRFAPSPTGRFHIGNLRTAWVSEKIARCLKTEWIVRVEDIDTARVLPEAWSDQKKDLASLGLVPDAVIVQSSRQTRHVELFERAKAEGRVYPCDCSRQDVLESLRQMSSAPHNVMVEYSGRCRGRSYDGSSAGLKNYAPKETLAWRWKSQEPNGYDDAIVLRTDPSGENFAPGYHWACAIDDADGNYQVIVRAWDLAPVDKIQGEIRKWATPSSDDVIAFHTSLVTRDDGGRLEKRTNGVTLEELLAAGESIHNLGSNFDASFDVNRAIELIRDAALDRAVRPTGELVHKLAANSLVRQSTSNI